jgi:hypothetical protein
MLGSRLPANTNFDADPNTNPDCYSAIDAHANSRRCGSDA